MESVVHGNGHEKFHVQHGVFRPLLGHGHVVLLAVVIYEVLPH